MDNRLTLHMLLWITVENYRSINSSLKKLDLIHKIVLGIILTNKVIFGLSTVSTMAITTIKDISIKSSMTNCLCEHRENSFTGAVNLMFYLDFTTNGALVSQTWHDRWSLARATTLISRLFDIQQRKA